jgi:hypothetical protein
MVMKTRTVRDFGTITSPTGGGVSTESAATCVVIQLFADDLRGE